MQNSVLKFSLPVLGARQSFLSQLNGHLFTLSLLFYIFYQGLMFITIMTVVLKPVKEEILGDFHARRESLVRYMMLQL